MVKIRCPKCGTWGEAPPKGLAAEYHVQDSHIRMGPCSYKCRSCGKQFGVQESALVDGIFLSKTRDDFKNRSRLYVQEICKALGLPDQVEEKTWDILERFNNGWGKRSTVAGAVYIAALKSGEKRTQRDIAGISNVTEVTVRNKYQKISEKLELDLGAAGKGRVKDIPINLFKKLLLKLVREEGELDTMRTLPRMLHKRFPDKTKRMKISILCRRGQEAIKELIEDGSIESVDAGYCPRGGISPDCPCEKLCDNYGVKIKGRKTKVGPRIEAKPVEAEPVVIPAPVRGRFEICEE